jgi:hypothetical protein
MYRNALPSCHRVTHVYNGTFGYGELSIYLVGSLHVFEQLRLRAEMGLLDCLSLVYIRNFITFNMRF